MRKSKYVVVAGVFILLTFFLCSTTKNIYEKKVRFTTIDEIINVINNKQLGAYDKEDNYILSSDYLECLSKRKRATGDSLGYFKLKLAEINEKEDELRRPIVLEEYKKGYSYLKGIEIPKKTEVRSYKATGYTAHYYYEGVDVVENDIYLDIVFIDEGEGWVIDMFWISQVEKEQEDVEYGFSIK